MAMIVIAAVSAAIEVGSLIYQLLNRPKVKPPVQDLQISSASEGAPIPFGYGTVRIAGNLIWTPGLRYAKKSQSAKGGPSVTTYTYYTDMAFAFCEGPAQIVRLWGDQKLIWSSSAATAEFPPEDFPAWDPTVQYNIGDIISYGGLVWKATNGSLNVAPGTLDPVTHVLDWEQLGSTPEWVSTQQYNPGDVVTYQGEVYVALQPSFDVPPSSSHGPNGDWNALNAYYPAPTVYPGDEAQLPDPTIQANEGVASTSANRGLCYCVLQNFPLQNFGNRIPSIRAELVIGNAPGKSVIDKNFEGYTTPFLVPPMGFPRHTVAGDYLVAFVRTRPAGLPAGGWDPGNISDTAGNTWNLIGSGNSTYAWWARAVGADDDVVTTASLSGTGFAYDLGYFLVNLGHIYQDWSDPNQYAGEYPIGTIVTYKNQLYQALTNIAGTRTENPPPGWTISSTKPPNAPSLWNPIQDNFDATFYSGSASGTGPGNVTINAGPYSVTIPVTGSVHYFATLVALAVADASAAPVMVAFITTDDGGGGALNASVPDGWARLFPDFSPDDFGLVITNTQDYRLASVLTNVGVRAGMDTSNIDTSLINSTNIQPTDIVEGYVVTRPTKAAEIVKLLMQAYFFDACETDGTLKFVPRGLPPALTIPEGELGLLADKAEVKPEEIGQEQDLPQSVKILFNDLALDFQSGMQQKERSTRAILTKEQQILEMPMTMDDAWAREVAEKTLWTRWIERLSYAFNLWRAYYLLLDPTDVVQFDYDSQVITARLLETSIGQSLATAIKSVYENLDAYESSILGGGHQGFIPTPLPLIPPTWLGLFDTPLLRDADSNPGGTGYYAGMSSVILGWLGAGLFRSTDDASFSEVDQSSGPVSYGYATTVLHNPASPFDWDTVNTLTIRMSLGALSSDTDANVLNGSNALLIGSPTNGWEVVQFANAVLNSDGTYTISRLLRGRRGTEWMCGFWGDFSNGLLTHATGDLVVLLDPAVMLRESDGLSTLNQLYYYRAVTNGTDISAAIDVQFTNTGNDLRPYAAVKVGGFFDSGGNLIITWERRTRIGGDGWGNPSTGALPLSEDSELYDVEVVTGSTVIRTVRGLTTPTMVYTVAMMTTDFGSPPASVTVNVYQISAQVGRGFKGHGVAPSATYAPETLPPSGDFYVNGA